MIIISDQIALSNILPLDPRESNVIFQNGFVKIETQEEYLSRVPLLNRYLGLDVIMLIPAGEYSTEAFLNLINTGHFIFNIYRFANNLEDLQIVRGNDAVINNLDSDSATDALSAAMGKELKRLLDEHKNDHNVHFLQEEIVITSAQVSDLEMVVENMEKDPIFLASPAANITDNNIIDWNSKAPGNHNHDGVYEPANINIQSHILSTSNPHNVTKTQIGLGNVPNIDTTNPANITQDSTHRFVTDSEKSTWNNKQEALGFTPENITNKVSTFQVIPDNTHYPTEKLVKDSLNSKQDTLVSGQNIKTLNNESLVGSGNITVQGAGGDVVGPNSSVDGGITLFDSITGKLIKDSGKTITTTLGTTDTTLPTSQAVKTYVDTKVGNAIRYQGDWDASNGTYPITGGSGVAGAIIKGDLFVISVAGTLGGVAIQVGDEIVAKIDTPGQTSTNWSTFNTNISYTPENITNKVTSISGTSTDTQYPSAKLVYDQLATKQPTGSYEVTTNKENTVLDNSSTKYPTNNLVKTYVDAGDSRISTGCLSSPIFTDNGNGTATVSSAQVNIYSTSNFSGNMYTYTIPSTTLSFTNGTEEYISVRYNSGNPAYFKETVGSVMNHSDNLPIFVVWRVGNVLHSLGFDSLGVGLANKLQSATYHDAKYKLTDDGGLVITESTTPNPRTIVVTGGLVYTGAIEQTVLPFNSSVDQLTFVYHVGGVWNYTDQLVYNNTQYDNGADLATIQNNKYSVRWFYRSIGDSKQVFYVLGSNGNYNSPPEAALELPRTDIPLVLKNHCMLIGRSIIQYNASTGAMQSILQQSYTYSNIINHDDTANKSLAGLGVTWGHINNLEQTIYGAKTFTVSPIVPDANNSNQAVNKGQLDSKANQSALTVWKNPTGFNNPQNVTVSYNYSNRTITLTGDLSYSWNGIQNSLTSPWTSTAHANTTGRWFLYSIDGINFTWSTSVWEFYHIMVASVSYNSVSSTNVFANRECHGLMNWESHRTLHYQIGTYRTPGTGQITSGTYIENTATDAANSPGFEIATVIDEDLESTISAWIEGSYTLMYVNSTNNTSTYVLSSALPFIATANTYIQVNNTTNGTMAAGINSRWYNVYQILLPTTSDTNSQLFRTIMLQPQTTFTSLAAAQAEDVRTLYLGELTAASPEYVFCTRITYVTSNADNNTGKCRIATGGISYITGSRASQVTISGSSPSSHSSLSNLTWSLSGHIGNNNTLASFDGAGLATYTNNNSTNWDIAYTNRISSLTTIGNSGTSTLISNVLNIPNYTLAGLGGEPIITAGTTGQYWRGDKSWQTLNTTAVSEGTNLYYTDARTRLALSITTTGNSGAATYNNTTGAFNIPQYTLSGLGGAPESGSVNYIQNQYSSPQGATQWISGKGRFDDGITIGTNKSLYGINSSGSEVPLLFLQGATNNTVIYPAASGRYIAFSNFANNANNLLIADSGEATFASSIQSTTAKFTSVPTTISSTLLAKDGSGNLTGTGISVDGSNNMNTNGSIIFGDVNHSISYKLTNTDGLFLKGYGGVVLGQTWGGEKTLLQVGGYNEFGYHSNVGVGFSSGSEIFNNKLAVNGNIYSLSATLSTGAFAGSILGGDASGNISHKTINQAIGGNVLTSGYLPYWDGSKLANSAINRESSTLYSTNSFWRIYRPGDTSTYTQIEVNDVSTVFNGYDPDGWMNYYFKSNGNTRLFINGLTGQLNIPNLSGTGTRVVGATADGTLTALSTLDTGVVTVNQNSHGFSVGNIIRISGANTYTKAKADSSTNAEVIGYVTEITDVNNFKYITNGYVTVGVPSATAGTVFYLDPTTAGTLTSTEPTTTGQISKPVLLIIESNSKAVFFNFRGMEITANDTYVLSTRTVNGKALSNDITLVIDSSDFTLSDNTTNNSSASKHGLLPKLSGSQTDVLRGDGTWGIYSSGSSFWTLALGSPTRSSNTSFTVTGDYSSIFSKGLIIKWTESSTVKLGMVVSSVYASPNTTITIIGDTMSSIDASSLKYSLTGAEVFIARFSSLGNISTNGSNIANAYYATQPMRVLGADLQVGIAGVTNNTTIDINKNGTSMFSTKPTLGSTVAYSSTPFTADNSTSLALNDKVTIDIDTVQSTPAADLYVQLYVYPTRYLNLS